MNELPESSEYVIKMDFGDCSSLLNDVAKYPDRTVASYIVLDDPESKVAVIDFKKGVGLKRMYIIITVSCSKSEGTI